MNNDAAIRIMLNAAPICGTVWNLEGRSVDCNDAALRFFGLTSKQVWLDHHAALSVQCQPSGNASWALLQTHLSDAFREGSAEFSWQLRRFDGRCTPIRITLTRIGQGDDMQVVAYAVEQHDSHPAEVSAREDDVRAHLMLDNAPLACTFWNASGELIDCNLEALKRYDVSSKEALIAGYDDYSPEYQPDGGRSAALRTQYVNEALQTGRVTTRWMHQSAAGEPMPCEATLIRVFYKGDPMVIAFIRDMREETRLAAEKREADERMQIMLDTNPLGCSIWDKASRIVDCNAALVRLFGLSNKQEVLARFSELSPERQANGERSADLIPRYLHQARLDRFVRLEWMHQKPNGEQLPVEVTLVRVQRAQGNVIAAYIRDRREELALQIERNEANEYSQLMHDATPLSCNLWDEAHNTIACNQEAVKLFELDSKQEYLDRFFELSPEYQPSGRLSSELAHEHIDTAFRDGYTRFEWMHQKLNGEPVPAEITLVRIQRANGSTVAGYARDLRELRNSAASLKRLETLAYTDKLTGISNRHYFLEQAAATLSNINPGESASLLLLDVDHFKQINDTCGHCGGDAILQGFAARIQEILRPYDLNSTASLKRLETLAYTDKLTGISNRQHFVEQATATLGNLSIGGSACLLLLDIDHFKRINDTYGHSGGDAILRELTARIQAILRPYDLFARYGGEEFVILLGRAQLVAAIALAERIRESIECTLFEYHGHAIRVTISIGIGDCGYPAPALQDMVDRADTALYQAKHDGRNRVEYSPHT